MADTRLSSTGSKYISTTPLYPGDLINNIECYYPKVNMDDIYWKARQMNAEGFTYDSSRFAEPFDQAFIYCSISGGWAGYDLISHNSRHQDKIREHSRRLTTEDDNEFLTIQKLTLALDHSQVLDDVFATNGKRNQIATETAAHHMPSFMVNGPGDREGLFRNLGQIHSMLRGSYEDGTYEIGIYGPELLIDTKRGIYHGDHAYSRNGSNEKAVGLAIQYGSDIPMQARENDTCDITDITGEHISLVDQAWEDARHVIDVTERGFRSETGVALLLSRFMHDEMWQSNLNGLSKPNAHSIVTEHYKSKEEMEKMEKLKSIMLPYIAEHCNWPTLHRILNADREAGKNLSWDMNLGDYWDNFVEPARPKLLMTNDIKKQILPYVPRGGFIHPKPLEIQDTPKWFRLNSFSAAANENRPRGVHEDLFSCEYEPKRYNGKQFTRLGHASNPDDTPHKDHYTFDQNAAIMMLTATRKARRPIDTPNRLLYLNDASAGLMGAHYNHKHGIKNPSETASKFNPLADESQTFDAEISGDHSGYLADRMKELTRSPKYSGFRSELKATLTELSDFGKAKSRYSGRRESLDAEMRQGIVAPGAIEPSGAAVDAAVLRYIDAEANGLIIPAGQLSGGQCRYIMEGVLVALGQVNRSWSGGKYDFDFFIDHDYLEKDPAKRGAPSRVDLGDIILHVGIQVKAALESKNPAALRDHYVVMAQLLDVYEILMDARRNKVIERDPISGEDKESKIVNITNIPTGLHEFMIYDPGLPDFEDLDVHKVGVNEDLEAFIGSTDFEAFCLPEDQKSERYWDYYLQDPQKKAQAVKMMWGYMRAKPGAWTNGMLLDRGIHAFDDFDLRDLPAEYPAAKEQWDNMTADQQMNIFNSTAVYVEGPGIINA